ncbi:MAG: saccharopine dehydrogenase [Flavobacteriales bacterium]|nr:saccharopine dehydrogenase [Flavobacteriales bacterium]
MIQSKVFLTIEAKVSEKIFQEQIGSYKRKLILTALKSYKMKKILVIGAGRSSSSLIKYLADNSTENEWQITITDRNQDLIDERVKGMANTKGLVFDALKKVERQEQIRTHDLVISMLPARFHIHVVQDCIEMKKNVITPSYISAEIKDLDEGAKKAGIIILNEMGLDPGLDHMSAMKVLDEIKESGGEMLSFKSFTGGLIAPESDNNPWNYKFTWNPRNVVMAGQGGAVKYIRNGRYKYIPYNQLFKRIEKISIDGYGKFDGYANRDSLKYRSLYNLEDIPTIYRGTLRRSGFCRAWDALVQLGVTDDTFKIEDSENMTYRDFINSFLAYHPTDSVELKLRYVLGLEPESDVYDKIEWLGLFEDKKIGLRNASPAEIMVHLLSEKWKLEDGDKDMIVMWHQFKFMEDNIEKEIRSSLVCIGDDEVQTGMAKTVGFPLGIAAKLLLQEKIEAKGVHLPNEKEIYLPILSELDELGISFKEEEIS